jgi:hypothetical protein
MSWLATQQPFEGSVAFARVSRRRLIPQTVRRMDSLHVEVAAILHCVRMDVVVTANLLLLAARRAELDRRQALAARPRGAFRGMSLRSAFWTAPRRAKSRLGCRVLDEKRRFDGELARSYGSAGADANGGTLRGDRMLPGLTSIGTGGVSS